MLCPKCGRNVDGDNFCPNCGTPIDEYQSSDSLLQTDDKPKISQNIGIANMVFIFGILANVFNALFFLGAIVFCCSQLYSNIKQYDGYEDFYFLTEFCVFSMYFSFLVIAALVFSIIGKVKASNYIRRYEQCPPKVRTGRTLLKVSLPFSIVLLIVFLIIVPLSLSNY